nr:hypothetical protein [Vicinamibacterales bacterium]
SDTAGQTAVLRSGEMLLGEGFQVNVTVLPTGEDPDTFIRTSGRASYEEKLRTSKKYLELLLDRGEAEHDINRDEGRRAFLNQMLTVAARIPDTAQRDQFADRLAHRARVMQEVVRTEIRKAAVERRPTLGERALPSQGQLRTAEKGLIWALMREPESAQSALAKLDADDIDGLASAPILKVARTLDEWPSNDLPKTLRERLDKGETAIVEAVAAEPTAPAPAAECGQALKRLRYERERAAVREEIDRLQELGDKDSIARIDMLLRQTSELVQRLEALNA